MRCAWYALAMRTYILSYVLLGACAHTPAAQRAIATMSNPLLGSDAQPAVFHNRIFHDIYGMPEDAVASSATITSANDHQVCLRVELRRGVLAMPNDRAYAVLSQWQVALIGNGKRSTEYHLETPTLSATDYDAQAVSAQATGTTLECKQVDVHGECRDAEWVQHWQVARSPTAVTITTGVNDVCFTNTGVLSDRTESLQLELGYPGAGHPELVFEWRFQSERV